LSILQALSRVASKFQPFDSLVAVGFKSPIVNEAISSLPSIATDIATFLSSFNHAEAANDDKFDMFKDDSKYEAITDHKMAIIAVEADLDEQLIEIRKMLKNSKLNYVTVAGIEVHTYLDILTIVFDRSAKPTYRPSTKELDQGQWNKSCISISLPTNCQIGPGTRTTQGRISDRM
jgi:hypothetical protein